MRWFRWSDVVPALITAAVAVLLIVWQVSSPAGTTVIVSTPDATWTLSLSDPTVQTVESGGYTLTLVVEGDGVCIDHADCPDQVCVKTGLISRTSQSIACVPAGVVVTLANGDGALDAVTR